MSFFLLLKEKIENIRRFGEDPIYYHVGDLATTLGYEAPNDLVRKMPKEFITRGYIRVDTIRGEAKRVAPFVDWSGVEWMLNRKKIKAEDQKEFQRLITSSTLA